MVTRANPFANMSNNIELIQDPHDSACSLAWDKRTKENQQACLKLYKEIKARVNVVYMIRINLKSYPHSYSDRSQYPHIMYPLEFTSIKDVHDWIVLSPDPALRPDNVKSWSVETIRKPLPPLSDPKIRKEDLPPP